MKAVFFVCAAICAAIVARTPSAKAAGPDGGRLAPSPPLAEADDTGFGAFAQMPAGSAPSPYRIRQPDGYQTPYQPPFSSSNGVLPAPRAPFEANSFGRLPSGPAGQPVIPSAGPAGAVTAPFQPDHCPRCNDGSCDQCAALAADRQDSPRFGLVGFEKFDTFRGPPEGAGPSNFGEVTGLNAAIPVYEPWGIAWQLGASYGIYDFGGRPPPALHLTGAQQQIFVTTGVFRRAKPGQRASFGFAHDWMINNRYSQYALSPTLGQWRGQFEWAFSGINSVGIWGTFRDRSYFGDRPDNHNQFRAISQIDAFWHHKYEFGADTWLRIGLPVSKRLTGSGLAGSAIVGATAQAPLNQQLALYANAMYMASNSAPGALGSSRDAYNVSMGVAWYPGGNARTGTVNGASWLPYMPLANNSNFLVDSVHFD